MRSQQYGWGRTSPWNHSVSRHTPSSEAAEDGLGDGAVSRLPGGRAHCRRGVARRRSRAPHRHEGRPNERADGGRYFCCGDRRRNRLGWNDDRLWRQRRHQYHVHEHDIDHCHNSRFEYAWSGVGLGDHERRHFDDGCHVHLYRTHRHLGHARVWAAGRRRQGDDHRHEPDGGHAVDFGAGNPGAVTSNTAGKIVVTSPASTLAAPGTGTVDVTVTTAWGTSPVVPADQFTYVGAPTVTALYGGNAPTGGGTTIIIQGTNFVGVTNVEFATTAATSYVVQSSTEISAVVPGIATEVVGTIYNVTVITGAGTSAKATANQWYWFGTGSCTFTGSGVQNSGAPPGASAYIQGAVAGTSPTNPSGGTAIPTSCTGLSGLGTTAPMIESLGAATAGVVTGTGPGGNGGNEEWLGWSGQNNYFDTTSATYNAPSPGFQLPDSGPSTTGGCPISGALCVTGAAGGTPVYYGTDPNTTCPPSQAQTDAGLVDCNVGALTAASTGSNPSTYIAATLQISYANDPTPDPATATFTSGTTAPGSTVTLKTCGTCNWWGAGANGAPSFIAPIGPAPATATAVPAPAVWVGRPGPAPSRRRRPPTPSPSPRPATTVAAAVGRKPRAPGPSPTARWPKAPSAAPS